MQNKIIPYVGSIPGDPFCDDSFVQEMARAVTHGGAFAIKSNRPDILAGTVAIPIIGCHKAERVNVLVPYTTATQTAIEWVCAYAVPYVCLDGTERPRPDGSSIEEAIAYIHGRGKQAVCDISTTSEGRACFEMGADIVTTALVGYTSHSTDGSLRRRFEVLEELATDMRRIILEGRVKTHKQASDAMSNGAWGVCIGTSITRPHRITQRFVTGDSEEG